MKYFPLLYRLRSSERYLIWISDELDSLAVDSGGFVPSFADVVSLRQYANLHHYNLEIEKPVLHDLDWVAARRMSPATPIDCQEALAAWNLFGDIAVSIPSRGISFKELKSQSFEIYDKLFWGNNLPAVTPKGERYIPEWSPDELGTLSQILTAGLELFESCTRSWPPAP